MEVLSSFSFNFTKICRKKLPMTQVGIFIPIPFNQKPKFDHSSIYKTIKPKFRLFTALSSSPIIEKQDETQTQDKKFDWYAQWYPIMPVCDLDKRAPHGKRVIGIDIVVWWDKNESEWKVFDDMCPHRLAPLSEGRIDQKGRLQCTYHGWCFSGSGNCKYIPQAPCDGPPVHRYKKACAAVYPSVVQNDIVWFWPNSDPEYSDILSKKKPPYIPELDDPSFSKSIGNRDLPYGYDVLVDNLMDPAHVPYAHYGVIPHIRNTDSEKADLEDGRPLEISVEKTDVNGFSGNQNGLKSKFIAPCVFHYGSTPTTADQEKRDLVGERSSHVAQKKVFLIFFCIPVSPGKSRLIWSIPRDSALSVDSIIARGPGNSRIIWSFLRKVAVWIDHLIPRWIFHVRQLMPVIDSDLYILHAEEKKIKEIGPSNWEKACFVPTKADAQVIAFRKWLNKYAGDQINWGTKFTNTLPPTPPREQLMDRYWTHVVNCQSCSNAYKSLNTLEVVLQVVSFALIGIVAATKQNMLSVVHRSAMISVALLCFVGSKWLSHFVYKNFRFHDYNHTFR